MQLYLIRHAESLNNSKPPQNRIEDPPITALGRQQAECMASWVEALRFDYLITSPFLRTLQTTRFITDRISSDVEVWGDVFERGGCYRGFGPDANEGGPGLGRSDIPKHVVDDPNRCVIEKSISESGWWFGKARETDNEATKRSAKVTHKVVDRFGDSEAIVVMVIHADFKRELLAQMLHQTADAKRLGPLRNCGVSKVDFVDGSWQLDWFNSVTHMPARMITGNES